MKKNPFSSKKNITKETTQELMSIRGETRGFNIRYDGEYILKTQGREGLKKLEEAMEKLGCPIDYLKINNTGFYPAGLKVVSLCAMRKVFGLGDEEIRRVGNYQPKISLVAKLLMKHFYSFDKMRRMIQTFWNEYWTIGEVSLVECSLTKRYAIVEVKDFDLHPIYCRFFEGYTEGMIKMISGRHNILCREKKCPFLGNKVHQFFITWE